MTLYEFQPNVGTENAFAIKAKYLDDNFAKLKPKSNGTYGINEQVDGWTFDIFPAFPQQISNPIFLTYNGRQDGITSAEIATAQVGLQWSTLTAGFFRTDGITAGAHLSADGSGSANWNYPPDGEPGWREVERCDGKKMYVWATEWA